MRNVGRAVDSRLLHRLVRCLQVDSAEWPKMPLRSVVPPAREPRQTAEWLAQSPMHAASGKLAGGEGQGQ
jgi:hypothetical protein